MSQVWNEIKKAMTCPEHNTDVEQCNCAVADSLIELSNKHTSDGMSQEEADEHVLELYLQSIGKQQEVKL